MESQMNAISFYRNREFTKGTASRAFSNIAELASLLITEYHTDFSATGKNPPLAYPFGLLLSELKMSPRPRWFEWLKVSDEDPEIAGIDMQTKANILDFTRLLLHHLGIDISPEEDVRFVKTFAGERLLLTNRVVDPWTVRMYALQLGTSLMGNLFACGQYQLGVSVANKLLMLSYEMVEELLIIEISPEFIKLNHACANHVVRWWRPKEQTYPPDVQLCDQLPPPTPDVWTSRKNAKKIGVCLHGILRTRVHSRCILTQVEELRDFACDG
jgi:hypothetical protein